MPEASIDQADCAPNPDEIFRRLDTPAKIARATELWNTAKRCELALSLLRDVPMRASGGRSISSSEHAEITRWLPEMKSVKAVLDALVNWPITLSQPDLIPPVGCISPCEMPEYADLVAGMAHVLSRDVGLLIQSNAIPETLARRNGVPSRSSVSFIRPAAVQHRVRSEGDLNLGFSLEHPRAVSIRLPFDRSCNRLWQSIRTFREQLEAAPLVTLSCLYPTESITATFAETLTNEANRCGASPADVSDSQPLTPVSINPPKASKRMTVDEANQKAMALAYCMKQDFFDLSIREQARQIGCAFSTWKKTDFYKVAQAHTPPKLARHRSASCSDETLESTISEQQKDYDPSPLDKSDKPNPKVRRSPRS